MLYVNSCFWCPLGKWNNVESVLMKIDQNWLILLFVFRISFYSVHLILIFSHYFVPPLIRYTAFSELLPLLAVGTSPLLKVKEIRQAIDTSSLTIVNSTTLSSPFATLSFSASATFEVRSPTRIQVFLWAISIWSNKIFYNKMACVLDNSIKFCGLCAIYKWK